MPVGRCRAALLAAVSSLLVAAPAAHADRSPSLQRTVLDAVRSAHLDQVYDFQARAPIAHPPNVDVAVLELSPWGQVRAAAQVLLSRDYPAGQVVPVNRWTLGSTAVRWQRWDTSVFDDARPWGSSADLVAGREGAPLRFMAPYPAGLFRVLVAYGVAKLADRGLVSWDAPLTYGGADGSLCGGPRFSATRTIAAWADQMIASAGDIATCALVKLLHATPAGAGSGIDLLDAELQRLGLTTLQVDGTDPATGGRWTPGRITMTSLDAAKLLLLVDGGPGVLWWTPAGRPVFARELSAASRDRLGSALADQGLHEVLSTGSWCGHTTPYTGARRYPAAGIPARVPDRWIDPATGRVSVPDVASYPGDVRPCNAAAQVTFAHQTGLASDAGADAGIVTSLPGRPVRRYVIAVMSNLGHRYGDPELATLPDEPCASAVVDAVCSTERLARLGAAIDTALATRRGDRRSSPHDERR